MKAVFVDRDGTINDDYGYVYTKGQFAFLPGVIQGLRIFQDLGYLIFIITNQSGISRGFYTYQEHKELQKYILELLKKHEIYVTDYFMCPHLPEDQCDCRKPELGLFLRAREKYTIDFNESIVIGDKLTDLSLCKKYLTKGFLISDRTNTEVGKNITCVRNLLEAAELVRNSIEVQ